ncbi:MAG: trypsin-like peptidase domain-containing protein [Chloroflexota bacterium]|nr:trypsin-like peptidase domain-containing protein [Chloroflexota bacterium]
MRLVNPRRIITLVALPLLAACSLTEPETQSANTTPTAISRPADTRPTSVTMSNPRDDEETATSATAGPDADAAAEPSDAFPGINADQELSVPAAVRSVRGGVVEIITQSGQGQGGTGSGFIIDKDANIITNNHVVEGASRITVVLDGNRIARARLVGADPLTDVAVVRIENKNVTVAKLGDSDKLQIGEPVIAIGSALGLRGGPTVTTGVVSSTKRVEIEPAGDPQSPQDDIALYDLIQTDTAINPGNSGGPLVNARGEVIGVNTLGQRLTGSGVPVQGINFAVSINTARSVAEELIRTGEVEYPYLGVEASFLTPQQAVREGIPYTPGQRIGTILPNLPAAKAGLRRGDIITGINGTRIEDESNFTLLLRENDPGDKVTLTVRRNGQEREFEVTLGRRPSGR